MVTIIDSDASNPAVDSVVSQLGFPFWLPTITITGESLLAMDGSQLNGAIILTPSVPVYIAGWAVLEGSAVMTVTDGVADPVIVPTTDSAPTPFTYTITQRLNTPDGINPAPSTGVGIPHSLGNSVDISELL